MATAISKWGGDSAALAMIHAGSRGGKSKADASTPDFCQWNGSVSPTARGSEPDDPYIGDSNDTVPRGRAPRGNLTMKAQGLADHGKVISLGTWMQAPSCQGQADTAG